MSSHPSTDLNFEDDVVEVTPQVVKDAERWDRAMAPPYLKHTQISRLDDLFPVQVVDAYKRLRIAEHDLRCTGKHDDGKLANAISAVLQRLDLMAAWAGSADEEVARLRVEKRGWAQRFEGLKVEKLDIDAALVEAKGSVAAKDAEIERLKDELARVNDAMEMVGKIEAKNRERESNGRPMWMFENLL